MSCSTFSHAVACMIMYRGGTDWCQFPLVAYAMRYIFTRLAHKYDLVSMEVLTGVSFCWAHMPCGIFSHVLLVCMIMYLWRY